MKNATVILALTCLAADGFGAFGKEYRKGDIIPPEDVEQWPEGALETRLDSKWVGYRPHKVEAEAPVPPLDPKTNKLDLEKMDGPALVAYAKQEFDVQLDHSNISEADLRNEVATLIAMSQE